MYDDFDDDDQGGDCPICFSFMDRKSCWHCMGEGGFHDCGEDTCCCLDKEEVTEICPECGGEGSYLVCASLPHTEMQMRDYRRRQTLDAQLAGLGPDLGGEG